MNLVHALSASSIRGTNVVNPQGENLGHVEDLMIDLGTGRIRYAVLSFGGILGIGDKLFAVPFETFTVDQKNENFILSVDRKRLENAPGFDKNNWPSTANTDFQLEVYRYYDVEPYWEIAPIR